MKRIITLFVSLLLLCCLLVPASAAESGKIVVDTVSAKPGDTVDVNIVAEKNPGIIATLLTIEYDGSALTLTGADNGTIFPDGAQQFGKDTEFIPYTMLWEDGLSTESYAEEGVLATLHFTVKEDAAEGEYEIKLQLDDQSTFDVDLNNVGFALKNGCVKIGSVGASKTMVTIIACAAGALVICAAVVVAVIAKKHKKKKEAAE